MIVIDVTGTSSGAEGDVVVDLVCSSECANVTATGTDLTAPNGTAAFVCQNIDTSQVIAVFSFPEDDINIKVSLTSIVQLLLLEGVGDRDVVFSTVANSRRFSNSLHCF